MSTTTVKRTRRETKPASRQVSDLGYFESAVVNGLGQIIKWDPATRTPPHTYDVVSDSPTSAQMVEDEKHPGPPYREGGNFLSIKYENMYDPGGVFQRGTYYNKTIPNGWTNRRYVGGFCPPTNEFFQAGANFAAPGPLLVKTNPFIPSMVGLGTRAWNATKPNITQADEFVDAFEADETRPMLRNSGDTIRSLQRSAKGFSDLYKDRRNDPNPTIEKDWWYLKQKRLHLISPKRVADEFLNVNFGWIPFINNIASMAKIVGYYRNLVAKYTRMNGRPIRKRVPLSGETNVTVLQQQKLGPPSAGGIYPMPCHANSWPAEFFVSGPAWECVEEKSTIAWAVGKFTYYRPEFDSANPKYFSAWNKAQRFLTITGLRVSPSALYNIIPWTWLIDYFTDVGNFVDYMTDIWQDQIVSNYCYAMQTKTVTRRFTNVLPFHSGMLGLTFIRRIESKQRTEASSPFSFDLSWDGLSPRQLAILAALGVSRSK